MYVGDWPAHRPSEGPVSYRNLSRADRAELTSTPRVSFNSVQYL
jgi:hypothetical protein